MKRYLPMFVLVMMLASAILSACVAPTPQVVTVKETVVASTEKVVQQTVVVEKEKIVEKEKVVDATPVPPPRARGAQRKADGRHAQHLAAQRLDRQGWPYLTNWESAFAVSPMAEGLFWPKPDGTLEPLLGESYTVSPDGLVYTLKLRARCQVA